jgi:hypothetical protein
MIFIEKDNSENKLFDNGGWEYIDPPHSAEELLAIKKQKEQSQK